MAKIPSLPQFTPKPERSAQQFVREDWYKLRTTLDDIIRALTEMNTEIGIASAAIFDPNVALLDRDNQEWTGVPNLYSITAAQVAALPLDYSVSNANPIATIHELGAHGIYSVSPDAPTLFGARVGGSIGAPVAVVSGNSLLSLRAFGHDGDEVALAGQVFIQAAENFSETNRGSNFRIDLVPIGTAAIARALTVQALASGAFVVHAEVPASPTEPSYSWRLDSDTGIGRSASNEMSFITGAVRRVVVDSSGRVIIGHTASMSIGGSQQSVQIHGTTIGGMNATRWSNSAGGAPQWTLAHSRAATVGGTPVTLTSGDTLGIIQFAGDDGTDLNTRGATITAIVENTVSTGVLPSRLDFLVQQAGGGAQATVLRLSSTLQAMAEIGTAALPSWTYRQDPDTGHYRAGSNIEGWATGAVHRVTLDASGRLMIGTPIFTAINSGGAAAQFEVVGTTLGTSGGLQARFSADNGFTFFNFLKSRAAAPASFTIVQAGDQIGRLSWSADDGVDYSTLVCAQNVTIDGTPAADALSGYWDLHINSGSSTSTEILRAGRYSNSGNEAYFRLTGNTNDTGTIDRTSAGIEMVAGTMPNDGLFPLLKWMSTDAQLTTNNPRMVAFIGVRSTQIYDGDSDGGARIVMGSHANDPGTGDPLIYLSMTPTTFDILNDNQLLRIGAGNDLNFYHDGTNSFIDNNTGNLILSAGGDYDVRDGNFYLNITPAEAASISGIVISNTTLYTQSGQGGIAVGGSPRFRSIRINTSIAAPSALLNAQEMVRLTAESYDGATVVVGGFITSSANENWSVGANGTEWLCRVAQQGTVFLTGGSPEIAWQSFFLTGATTAQLGVSDGSSTFPSLTFWADTDTGLYRAAANNVGAVAAGVAVFDWTSLRVNFDVPYGSQAYTVAGLAALTPAQGWRAHVTDALAPAFGVAVAGGGAVPIPVFYDGTNWLAA